MKICIMDWLNRWLEVDFVKSGDDSKISIISSWYQTLVYNVYLYNYGN